VNPEPLHVPTISNCLRPKKSAARVNVFRDVVSARRSLPATAAGPAVKNGPNRPAQRAARGVLDCPETAELPRTSRRPKFRDRARLPWRIGGRQPRPVGKPAAPDASRRPDDSTASAALGFAQVQSRHPRRIEVPPRGVPQSHRLEPAASHGEVYGPGVTGLRRDRPPDIRDGRSDRRTPVGSASQMPNAHCDARNFITTDPCSVSHFATSYSERCR
jgi:hypothetical protein